MKTNEGSDQRVLFIGIEASGIAVGEGEGGALAVGGAGEAAAAGEEGTVVAEQRGVVLRRANRRRLLWQQPAGAGDAMAAASRVHHPLPDHRREPMVEVEPNAAGRLGCYNCNKQQHDDGGNGDEEIAMSHGEKKLACAGDSKKLACVDGAGKTQIFI